jgi:hypothetical protein
LDLRFKSFGILKISALLWACSQPLSMQQILPKSTQVNPNQPKAAQNSQNLPKFAQRQNCETPPKIKILVFFKNKIFYA